MAKAATTDLTDRGFAEAMFGAPADFTAYLQAVLDAVALHVQDAVGATAYAAASGADLRRITDAEIELASAELWRRRAGYLAASAVIGAQADELARSQREYRASANAAEERAWELLERVTGETLAGGLATGHVTHDPFVGDPADAAVVS